MHLYQNGYKMDSVINLIRPLERALEVEFLVRVSQKNKVRCRIFINIRLSPFIFEVKKSEIYFSEPRSITSKNGHIFGLSKLSRTK